MKQMRWALFLAAGALVSCNPKVQFSEPMPPARFNLPNIPKAYRGVIEDDDTRWQIGKDTIIMGEEVMVNGEDFLLRRMAGHLVMSQPVVKTGQWEVIVIKREGDFMRTGWFDDDDDFIRKAGILLDVPPAERKSNGTPGYSYYLLSPSAKAFKEMLKGGWYEANDEVVPLPRGGTVTPLGRTPQSN